MSHKWKMKMNWKKNLSGKRRGRKRGKTNKKAEILTQVGSGSALTSRKSMGCKKKENNKPSTRTRQEGKVKSHKPQNVIGRNKMEFY